MTCRRKFWPLALAALITLIAFALRVADLAARSIWLDEGATLLRLSGTLADNLSNYIHVAGMRTIDTQPQVYFLLLQGFIGLAGEHEFTFRFFSVAFGVLCMPLVYALAQRMFNTRTAVIAATFVALSPGLIWYSREIRMYSLTPFLAAAMTYAAYACSQATRHVVRAWLLWIVMALTSLLTHYSFAGLALGQGMFLVAVTALRWPAFTPGQRRAMGISAVTLAAAGVATLLTPFVQTLVARLYGGQEYDYAFVPLLTILHTQFGGFLLGLNAFDFSAGVIGLLTGALCLLAVIAPRAGAAAKGNLTARMLLATSVAAPIAFWFAISFLKPNYQGFRHLILVTPAVAVLLAYLCDWLAAGGLAQRMGAWSQALGGALCAAIITVQLYGAAYTFTRTPDWQDDWRSLAYYVRDHWQPGDLLVIGGLPTVALPITPYLRGVDWVSENGADAPANLPATTRRVWYVNRGSDQPHWLNGAAFLRRQIDFPARSTVVQLRLLELQPPITTSLPDGAHFVESKPSAEPSASVLLSASHFLPGAALNPQPNATLSLFWSHTDRDRLATLDRVNVSLRLLHDNAVWLDVNVPAGLEAAPAAWPAGAFFRTDHLMPIQLGLPDLPYQLEMTVLAGDKQEPVQRITRPLTQDELACCLRLPAWPGRAQPMTVAAAARPQPLLDFQPARIDFPALPAFSDVRIRVVEHPSTVHPGQPLPIVLTWQANRADLAPWQTELKVETLLGSEVTAVKREAGTPAFPSASWPADELVRDQYALPLPFSAQPGWYRLSLTRWRGGRPVDGALLGLIRVEDYPSTPVARQVQHPVNARVGELGLLGYSVNGPVVRGKTYDFVTHWRVEQAPTRDGVLFLHLLSPDGKPVSQDDNPPFMNGAPRSTLTYRAGDGIDQIHRLTIPDDLPAGDYRLYAGIYDRQGEPARWPAQQDGQPARDNLVHIGTVPLP